MRKCRTRDSTTSSGGTRFRRCFRSTRRPSSRRSRSTASTTSRIHTCRKSSGPSASCDRRPHGDLSKTEAKVRSIHIVRSRPAPFDRTSNRHIGMIPPPVGKIGLPGSGIYHCRAFRRDAYGGGGGGGGGPGGGGGGTSVRRRRLRTASAIK